MTNFYNLVYALCDPETQDISSTQLQSIYKILDVKSLPKPTHNGVDRLQRLLIAIDQCAEDDKLEPLPVESNETSGLERLQISQSQGIY